jgi:hypothetical protein
MRRHWVDMIGAEHQSHTFASAKQRGGRAMLEINGMIEVATLRNGSPSECECLARGFWKSYVI